MGVASRRVLTGGIRKGLTVGRGRLSPTLALVCVLLLSVVMAARSGGYFVWDWGPVAIILAFLVLAVSVIGLPAGPRLRWGILALGLLAAYAAWTFASLAWSADKGSAWLGAGQTLLYLMTFWISVSLVALGASRRWVLVVCVLGPAAVASLTLATVGSRPETVFENGRLVGTMDYYNAEAAFLLGSFWIAVYLGGSRRVAPILRGAVLAGAVLSANLAVLVQSRGAMVAMLVTLPVFFLLSGQRLRGLLALLPLAVAIYAAFPDLNAVYLAFSQGESPGAALDRALPIVWLTAVTAGLYGLCWGVLDQRWTPSRSVGLTAGWLATACFAVLICVGTVALVGRFGNPAELALQRWEAFKANDTTGEESSRYLSASGTGRFPLWQVAWRDFTAHPVLGVGTQNYEATYYQLREQNAGTVRQPHALPLEVVSERGAVGGVLLFAFLLLCVGVGVSRRLRRMRPEARAQVAALVAAVAYWFVHSSAEWFWQLPAVTLTAFVYLALLVAPWGYSGEDADESDAGGLSSVALRLGGAGFAVLALAVVVPLYAADSYLQGSHAAGTPEEALNEIERAQRFDPLSAHLPEREAEISVALGDWERAEGAYVSAIRLDPEHYAPRMLLATFHENRGDLEKARIRYREALALNPLDRNLQRRVDGLEKSLEQERSPEDVP